MTRTRAYFWTGLGCLLVGGALLALAADVGTVVGTTLGLAGAGLLLWSWARR